MTILAWLALASAGLSAALCLANLVALCRRHEAPLAVGTLVSVLIPARDEARSIRSCVEAALASTGVPVEVVVMDDGSSDATATIVAAVAARDPRVRLLRAPPLPAGWAGKPHACLLLAEAARGSHLLFVDADVRIAAHAAAALAAHATATGSALVSAVPRQRMATLGELLTVPMINFLICAYLPIARMRASGRPALAAACGQLVLIEGGAYRRTGGHALVRASLHESLQLARSLRAAGLRTDLVAGAGLASCRMYAGLAEAWAGFTKNAHEGMARPLALPVWTLLLGTGHLLPPILVLADPASGPALAALLLSLLTRAAITLAARESPAAIPLHPLTVATGLAIQWGALLGGLRGRPARWKGRVYPSGPQAETRP